MVARLIRGLVIAAVGLAVLVLDPTFGLADDATFGAKELRAVLEGTWQLTLTPADGPEQTLTFTLAQGSKLAERHAERSLIPSAHACANRTLVRSAGACAAVTRMPLDVTLIADGERQLQDEPGEFSVEGNDFVVGYLRFRIGAVRVDAYVTRQDKVKHLQVSVDHHGVPSTLARTAR